MQVFRLDKPINDAHFSQKSLETALKKVIREATNSENTPLADYGDPSCPVFVVTTFGRIADGPVKLFRSYGFDKDPTPIWQAAQATSAAPALFPPVRVAIPAPPGWYMDGGTTATNPSLEALVEAQKYWKTRKCFVVSIGSGIQKSVIFIGKKKKQGVLKRAITRTESKDPEPEPTQDAQSKSELHHAGSKTRSTSLLRGLRNATIKIGETFHSTFANLRPFTDQGANLTRTPRAINLSHVANALVNLSTSSQSTHLKIWEEANSQDESAQFPYFRFNVSGGMDNIGLEEWRMAEAMAALTRSYLESPDVKVELGKCAEGLLNQNVFDSKQS